MPAMEVQFLAQVCVHLPVAMMGDLGADARSLYESRQVDGL
jgi:hypothetical protein